MDMPLQAEVDWQVPLPSGVVQLEPVAREWRLGCAFVEARLRTAKKTREVFMFADFSLHNVG